MGSTSRLHKGLGTVVFVLVTLCVMGWAVFAVRHVVMWGSVVRGAVMGAAVGLALLATWAGLRYRSRLAAGLGSRRAALGIGAAIVLLAVLLRVLALVAVPVAPRSDAAQYMKTGKAVARGEQYHISVFHQRVLSAPPPGYALLLAGGYRLFGEQEWVAPAINLLLGLGIALGGAWLAAGLGGQAVGLVALAVLALLPLNVAWIWLGLSEVPFGAFLLLGLACVGAGRAAPGAARAVALSGAGGLVLGYSALCRPQALLVVPFALLLAIRWNRPGRLGASVALLAGLALAIAPWTLRNYLVHGGRFVLIATNGGPVFYSGNSMNGHPAEGGKYHEEAYARLSAWCPDEIQRDKLGYRLGRQEIAADWSCFLESLLYRYEAMWSAHLQPLVYAQLGEGARSAVAALVLWGYWFIPALYLVNWSRVRRLFRQSALAQGLGAVYATYMVALIPFEVNERSHYPAMLLPLVLALGGLLRKQGGGQAEAGESCAS